MIRILTLALVTLFFSSALLAQEALSWKKHKKLADKLFEAKQYADAAQHYEVAWRLHSKDKELAYKAGECYSLIKDFKKAIQAYEPIKTENDRFELIGLKHARALKQDGQYEAAKQALMYFTNAYQGDDKAIVSDIASNEIKGCEKAIELQKNPVPNDIILKHLGEGINSPAIEFAPIPYTDDLLYYSSTMKGHQAYLFRTQRKNGAWQKSILAQGLPDFANKHFANGSFSPDAKRFYFTLCNNGDGLSSKCEIYVLKREQAKWSQPIRLRNYINIDNANTTTQPWVIHQNGQEILYFSSDREGGFGGMDIWYTTRNIESGDIDFTYPINAGSRINTMGDEITPYYNIKEKQLYFSSNGKVTLGGWDIFQAKGALNDWEQSENLGFPINSSADDFYYVLKPSGKGGFLASNRLHGMEKISTQHEDIFEFFEEEKITNLYALGQIMDAGSMRPLSDVRVSLYEIIGGKEKLLSSKVIAQSNYRFQILPNKKLRLIAYKKGYLKNTYDFNSDNADHTSIDYTHIFSLQAKKTQQTVVQKKPKQTKITTRPMPNYTASTNTDIATEVLPKRNVSGPVAKPKKYVPTQTSSNNTKVLVKKESIAEVPRTKNTITSSDIEYKVQLIAVNYHNANHPRYDKIRHIGTMETERLEGKGLIRVLIGGYTDKALAKSIKDEIAQNGFLDAFVVKYRNGRRLGRLW